MIKLEDLKMRKRIGTILKGKAEEMLVVWRVLVNNIQDLIVLEKQVLM